MPYYDNPGTAPDEAINVVNGKVFNVVQLADTEGNVVDPGSGGGGVTVANTDENPVPTSVPSRTPTTAQVPSSTSSVTILPYNSDRRGLGICNLSTANLYLSFSSPATTDNCFIQVPAGAFILLDQQLIVPNAIYGLWDDVDGNAQVTEFV